jgi:hypothetical protein
MATILDLFKSRKTEIYGGEGGKVFIESQGLINIPRKAALLASSPNAVGALIGNEVGGLVKGSADRPSDLVFNSNKALSKPVIISPRAISRGLKYAFDAGPGEVGPDGYYVKKYPEPPTFLNKIEQGISTPGSVIQEEAAKILKNPESAFEGIKFIKERLEGSKGDSQTYGPALTEDKNDKLRNKEKKFSKFAPKYGYKTGQNQITQIGISDTERSSNNYESILRGILTNTLESQSTDIYKNFENKNKDLNFPFVLFETYGNGKKILLPGTITGLSEDMTPEWSNFKYLGSPFNLYRYGGVERSIKFELKLYYIERISKLAMIANLNKLRQLVFPTEIAAINYPDSNSSAGTLAIKPNLVWLTISDVYKKVLGVIDSLSFNIDDSTPWASTFNDVDGNLGLNDSVTIDNTGKYDSPYPSVINVSISMKIIESPFVSNSKNDPGKFVYEYAEDDNAYFTNFTDIYNKYSKNLSSTTTDTDGQIN